MDLFKIKLPKLSWVLGTLFVIIFRIINNEKILKYFLLIIKIKIILLIIKLVY